MALQHTDVTMHRYQVACMYVGRQAGMHASCICVLRTYANVTVFCFYVASS